MKIYRLSEHHPLFRHTMAFKKLLGSEVSDTVDLENPKDGSGIEATFLTASNSQYSKSTSCKHSCEPNSRER